MSSFLTKNTTHDRSPPVRIESPKASQISKLDSDAAAERMIKVRAAKGKFQKGNKMGGRKPKLAKLGMGKFDGKDPAYQACLRQAESYRRNRVKEYTNNFGHVSIGVRGLLATASLQLAASRYMMDKGMELGDMDLLKKGSQLANDSRQNELAAWELCSREGVAYAKAKASEMPWMVRVADDVVKKSSAAIDGTKGGAQADLTDAAETENQLLTKGIQNG